MTPEKPQTDPIDAEIVEVPAPEMPAPPESETVGTGSYIAVSCTLAMLVLLAMLIGVVFLLRWIG